MDESYCSHVLNLMLSKSGRYLKTFLSANNECEKLKVAVELYLGRLYLSFNDSNKSTRIKFRDTGMSEFIKPSGIPEKNSVIIISDT